MKRNTESRYRIKIFQEWHLKKEAQKYIDKYMRIHELTYKEFFKKYTRLSFQMFSVLTTIQRQLQVLSKYLKRMPPIIQRKSECTNNYLRSKNENIN